MYEYKFKTVISDSGIIVLPEPNALFGKEVEVTITSNEDIARQKPSFDEFVNKWSGFLKDETKVSKFEYLSEKYK